MVVKSTLYNTKNVTTPDEVVIQNFRSQGVSILIGIRHVIYISKKVDFLQIPSLKSLLLQFGLKIKK